MPRAVTEVTYRQVFEDSALGAAVLEDLVQRFSRCQAGSGIDRVLNLSEHAGRQQVLNYILSKINQANGVQDESLDAQQFDG